MNVLLLANDAGINPYQTKLAEKLEWDGHEVSFSYRNVLPVLVGYYDSNPDVVHFHWLRKFILADSAILMTVRIAQFFLELVVLTVVSDSPIVWTVHNRREHRERWPTVERYVKHTFAVLFCDRLIVHCSAAEDAIVEELGLPEHVHGRIDVVPHGNYISAYENEVSEADAREYLDLPADERVLLFIGSIRPYKQVPSLLETFDRANTGNARLVITGKPWNDEIQEKITRFCADHDRIDANLGVVPQDEFQYYLNAADAVVLPFNGNVLTSGSVLLGMSFGTAVVAPRVGCIPEIVPDDGGILYDPAEEDALREAIEATIDADLETFGRCAFTAAQRFDWQSIACRTGTVYETALDR
jgi:glycosyltransferase involved in cell wall biosynthesis